MTLQCRAAAALICFLGVTLGSAAGSKPAQAADRVGKPKRWVPTPAAHMVAKPKGSVPPATPLSKPKGPAPTPAAHVAVKSKVLMRITGRGLAFNGVLALGSWDKPKNSFLAPARFKVLYSYICAYGGDMQFGIAGYNGAVQQLNIASALSASRVHNGTAVIASSSRKTWAFNFLATNGKKCSWDFTAKKL
jgi:hypothetical protein